MGRRNDYTGEEHPWRPGGRKATKMTWGVRRRGCRLSVIHLNLARIISLVKKRETKKTKKKWGKRGAKVNRTLAIWRRKNEECDQVFLKGNVYRSHLGGGKIRENQVSLLHVLRVIKRR